MQQNVVIPMFKMGEDRIMTKSLVVSFVYGEINFSIDKQLASTGH